MIIRIFNTTRDRPLPQKKLAKLVRFILVWEKKEFDVNLILVGKHKIQSLNKKFRGNDQATDVLSFSPEKNEEPPHFEPIGEIYICLPLARKQAFKAGHSLTRELLFLTAHGVLHLCGYTHQTEQKSRTMQRLTQTYLERYGG